MTPGVELLAPGAASDEAVVDAVARVINEAYAVGEEGLWLEGATRITTAEVGDLIHRECIVVARVDGTIVGCACVQPIDDTTADIGLISVTPRQWGGGTGTAIVRGAEDLVRSRGVTTMQLELLVPQGWVHPNKDRLRVWYGRLGYEVVRTAPFEEVAAHLAPQLATACEFLVFRKSLA